MNHRRSQQLQSLLARTRESGIAEGERYHYTSTGNFLSILEGKALWASEIRYMNDAQEVTYFARALSHYLKSFSYSDGAQEQVRIQFLEWVEARIVERGHSVFVISLSQEGNQLSQWRSYTSIGRGISIGFNAARLRALAHAQGFHLVRCIYDDKVMQHVCEGVLEAVLQYVADDLTPSTEASARSHFSAFSAMEGDILQLSALFKHPAFAEEKEWRLISETIYSATSDRVKLRPGSMSLVPYMEFTLDHDGSKFVERGPIANIFVGPTTVPELARSAAVQAISRSGLTMNSYRVSDCCIPLRAF